MLLFQPIFGLNLLYVFFCVIVINGTSSSMSVTECLEVLKNVYEDERRIREYFHEYSDVLTKDTCGNHGYKGKFSNCADMRKAGVKKSGVYTIYPKLSTQTRKIRVYCDMQTDGGGWTVFQRRAEYPGKQINFSRGWHEFAEGFGNLAEEFWLGNDNIHILTNQEEVELRVDLQDFEEESRYAVYDYINVGDNQTSYILTLGNYSGDAGDSMKMMNNQPFSTFDNCANCECFFLHQSAWWFEKCYLRFQANLNGVYKRGRYADSTEGIIWLLWHGLDYSLKQTEMKIRPKYFNN